MVKNSYIYKYKEAIILFVFFIIHCIRCFSGQGSTDEHFYSAIAYKFAIGSNYFIDDWHIAQLMTFVTAPLVKIYLLVLNSTDGIVLYFRFCYVIMSLITTILINNKFKEYKHIFIISVIYFMFVPFNITSMSYNTISINFLMQALCLYDYKNNKWHTVLSGILFAYTCLCSPYLVIFYIIYFIYRGIDMLKKREWNIPFLYSFLGICIVIAIFLVTVLKDTNISELIHNLKYVLNDESHSSPLYRHILRDGYGAYQCFGIFIFILVILSFINFFKKSTTIDSINYVFTIISILYYLLINKTNLGNGGNSVILLPIIFLGFSLLSREENKKIIIYYIVFLCHSIATMFSTNVMIRATCNTMISSAVISLIMLENSSISLILKKLFIYVTTYIMIICRLTLNYSDPVINPIQIKEGPLKYLYTSEEYNSSYLKVMSDVKKIDEISDDKDIYLISDLSYIFSSFQNHHIINYSSYQFLWSKEDIINKANNYLNEHSFSSYYVYVMENQYNVNINDTWSNYTEIDLNLECGKLYLITDQSGK